MQNVIKLICTHFRKNSEMILVVVFALLSSVFIYWQTGRILPLFDYSYQVENAYRIAIGQIPYKDFILITTPLMHYLLAFFMKVFGFSSIAPLLYMLIVSFVTVILTYQILDLLEINKKIRIYFLTPLIIATHGIVPLPSYDVTATLFVLLSLVWILKLFTLKKPHFSNSFVTGILLALPMLSKQNVGVAYLMVVYLTLFVMNHGFPKLINKKIILQIFAGTMTIIALFCTLLISTHAFIPFIRQNIFVFINRDPLNYGPAIFHDLVSWKNILIYLPILLVFISIRLQQRRRFNTALAMIAVILSFIVIPTVYFYIISNQTIYTDLFFKLRVAVRYFFSIWYAIILLAVAMIIQKIARLKKLKKDELLMLFVEIVLSFTTIAAFFAQGVAGSTFGIYPFFVLLLSVFYLQWKASYKYISWDIIYKTALILSTVFLAIFTYFNIRQSYVQVAGKPQHFVNKKLLYLGTPGVWTKEIDEMFEYVNKTIPSDQTIVAWPGEDPFYFVTGRKPMLRYFELFSGALPYTPEKCVKDITDNNIDWLIIKTHLQSTYYMDTKPIIEGLQHCYKLFKQLSGYSIYKKYRSC